MYLFSSQITSVLFTAKEPEPEIPKEPEGPPEPEPGSNEWEYIAEPLDDVGYPYDSNRLSEVESIPVMI